MIMSEVCPHCGSEDITYDEQTKNEGSTDTVIREFSCTCSDCGEQFLVSEVLTVTSRLVARSYDELERLIEKEEKENRRR